MSQRYTMQSERERRRLQRAEGADSAEAEEEVMARV